ncbi:hypothetical protein FSARC_9697 [Fusarium sarcochroum]|uniref:C2H2-type domain-containing protein n=1 Tax=Fusarium sarcochroum TaxID=1208366 RepID=A0A8H4TQW3_9HYPO|nr:hypothetical protein FSARC_9697 [Fusarium sarcochroum]
MSPKEEDGCDEDFAFLDGAKSHANCRYCGKTFKRIASKRPHEKNHDNYACPRINCHQRFDTVEEALDHAESINHRPDLDFYKCIVPDCKLSVTGKVMTKSDLENRRELHRTRGHLSQDDKLVYERAQHSIPNITTEADDLDPEEEEEEEEEASVDFEEEDKFYLKDENEAIDVLEQNKEWFETHRYRVVCVNSRGYTCAGPGIRNKNFITEPCPGQVTIGLDTALLRRSRGRRLPSMSLDRCVSCQAEMKIRRLTKRFDSPKPELTGGLQPFRKAFESMKRNTWTFTKEYNERVQNPTEQIRRDKQPGSFVVVLDTEFPIAT